MTLEKLSIGVVSAYQGIFFNIWRYVHLSQLEGSTGILWVGVRDAIKHPTVHKTALSHLPTKNYPGQNVNRVHVEKLYITRANKT